MMVSFRFNELIALVKKDQTTMKRGHEDEKKGKGSWRKYRLVANASGDLNRSSREQ
jgi:stalled ribosome alternative rescue factor ArfA